MTLKLVIVGAVMALAGFLTAFVVSVGGGLLTITLFNGVQLCASPLGSFAPGECAQLYAVFAVPVIVMVAGIAILARGVKKLA